MDNMFAEMISTATIGIALFGAAYALMQNTYRHLNRSFALFLGAVTLANIPDAFDRLFVAMPGQSGELLSLFLWHTSALCLAPLFWIYVCMLTSAEQQPPPRLRRHFLLSAFSALTALAVILVPADVSAPLVSDAEFPNGEAAQVLLIVIAIAVLVIQLAVYPQMAIYLFLIVRRMMRYRLTLRDYYASTEQHELRWIYVIGGLAWLYWIALSLMLLFALDPDATEVSPIIIGVTGLASLGVLAAMTLWGLRQRPPLAPAPDDGEPPAPTGPPMGEKYEKSALSAEASSRIARKLRAAMEQDHLHRDPNLSLWALARHVGASPNYISQTLSEAIGESFFDFVNGYRIEEAKVLLSTTDDTVLAITYEVGFNARSSFYNAFKRVTGQTPTHYRKTLSFPAGMDDGQQELRDTSPH
ncbi:AraC family transcriptional regulator [uncultured Tateyamaria sp.]|uniref:helix-turn-helix domain-containing protein n=1 Tax=uncultured Tateyamaria sp. TaxID=455651 RepID=UPI002622ADED|nr:AraC family transcriptional regulator [uncultured Tateyamaria sp.]